MTRQLLILKNWFVCCLKTINETTKAKNVSAQCLYVCFIFSLLRQYIVSHFKMSWRIQIT